MRSQILHTARALVLEQGRVPSLNAVVEAAGVSKGGLVHHFPTRCSLVVGLARATMERIDAAMSVAAAEGRAALAWIELSLPDADERRLMQALAAGVRLDDPEFRALLEDARSAVARWEQLIAVEIGDPVRARVLRLVGDALVANAVSGLETAPEELEEVVGFLTDARHTRGSGS